METSQDARDYFKSCNIEYTRIQRNNIDKLIELIKIELKEHKCFPMRLSKIVKFNTTLNGFDGCYLSVNGKYFRRRQAISFESRDWIGFSGWASSNNTLPFINAFIKWCDYMVKEQE